MEINRYLNSSEEAPVSWLVPAVEVEDGFPPVAGPSFRAATPDIVWEHIGPYYVYVLCYRDQMGVWRPFYVGKGTGNRAEAHQRNWQDVNAYVSELDQESQAGARAEWSEKIRTIDAAGGDIQVSFAATGIQTEPDAYAAESAALNTFKLAGYPGLTNLAPPRHPVTTLDQLRAAVEMVALRPDDRLFLVTIDKEIAGRELTIADISQDRPSAAVIEKTMRYWQVHEDVIAAWEQAPETLAPTHVVGLYKGWMACVLRLDPSRWGQLAETQELPVLPFDPSDPLTMRLQGKSLVGKSQLFLNYARGVFYAGCAPASIQSVAKTAARWQKYLAAHAPNACSEPD